MSDIDYSYITINVIFIIFGLNNFLLNGLNFYYSLLYDASKNNGNATPNYGPYEKLFLSDWGQSKIHYDILQVIY